MAGWRGCTSVGIDLGTTSSTLAMMMPSSEIDVIEADPSNHDNMNLLPSYVAFGITGEALVGMAAKIQLPGAPKNTIYDAKRMIGRQFDDPNLRKNVNNYEFEIEGKDGKPVIKINTGGQTVSKYPEDISKEVLLKLKEKAQNYLGGGQVENAVITVPAYFNYSQRLGTLKAANDAGFTVLRLLNEPTAAIIASCYHSESMDEKKNVLAYDFGGGTFDITILLVEDKHFMVKSTSGNTHLGGRDIDNLLLEHFKNKIACTSSTVLDGRAISRLRAGCEHLKILLSSKMTASYCIDALYYSNGKAVNYELTMDRDGFEPFCIPSINTTLGYVDTALREANMVASDIDELVMVGGCTRIPIVRKKLQEKFPRKRLNTANNPFEIVAEGAAIHAGLLTGYDFLDKYKLSDVTPLNLGIRVKDGSVDVIIKKNTKMPDQSTRPYTTAEDYQTSAGILIYEGNEQKADDNKLLGKCVLTNIPPKRAGLAELEVTFNIDRNGLMTVNAMEKSTGVDVSCIIEVYCTKGNYKPVQSK